MSRRDPTARLAAPVLRPLVDALAARYRAGDDPVTVTLRGLDDDAQQALADLLGEARTRGAAPRLAVTRIAAALGLEGAAELRAAVVQLRGPLADRRAERVAEQAARRRLWDDFAEQAAVLSLPWGREAREAWLGRLRAWGVRGGIGRHRGRLAGVLAVLGRLPADGVALPVLAQQALGDPHGLDPGRTVRAFVLDALVAAGFGDPAHDAESARRLWEAAGVAPDPLSSTVLTLGLEPAGDDPLATFLRASTRSGEPAVVTLAQLRRWPLAPLPPRTAVFVVENPSLVLEAARRGLSAVLVCSSGRPTVAVVTALRQLSASGAVAHQHADYDPQGLAITEWLRLRAGTRPWRMGAADYERGLAATTPTQRVALRAAVPPTPWDPLLQRRMTEAGAAVYEEAVGADLLSAMAGGRW